MVTANLLACPIEQAIPQEEIVFATEHNDESGEEMEEGEAKDTEKEDTKEQGREEQEQGQYSTGSVSCAVKRDTLRSSVPRQEKDSRATAKDVGSLGTSGQIARFRAKE